MSKQKRDAPKLPKQSDHFIDVARAIGADEDEAAFEERLRRIAKANPLKSREKVSKK